MTSPLLLTPEEAAQRLGMGRTVIFNMIASGELESVKIGRLRRIPADACSAYVDRVRASQPAPVDKPDRAALKAESNKRALARVEARVAAAVASAPELPADVAARLVELIRSQRSLGLAENLE